MDRSGVRIVLTLSMIASSAVAACSGSEKPSQLPLGPGQSAVEPSSGRSPARVASRSTLAYHVAFAGPRLVSVELTTRFALVIRDLDEAAVAVRSIDLGAPDFDVHDLVTSSDGRMAFVASAAGWVRGYELATGSLTSEWYMGSSATSLAIGASGEHLVIGTGTGVLCLRRLPDGAQLHCVHAHPSRVSALDLYGDTLVSADFSGSVSRWSLPSLRRVATWDGEGFISDVAISPDGSMLAIARNRRSPTRTPELNALEAKSPAVDPVGHNGIAIHPLAGGEERAPITLVGPRSVVSAIAWNGTDLIATSWDRTVQIWNTRAPGNGRRLLRTRHLASDIASSEAGGQVAVASWAAEDGHASITWLSLLYPTE